MFIILEYTAFMDAQKRKQQVEVNCVKTENELDALTRAGALLAREIDFRGLVSTMVDQAIVN